MLERQPPKLSVCAVLDCRGLTISDIGGLHIHTLTHTQSQPMSASYTGSTSKWSSCSRRETPQVTPQSRSQRTRGRLSCKLHGDVGNSSVEVSDTASMPHTEYFSLGKRLGGGWGLEINLFSLCSYRFFFPYRPMFEDENKGSKAALRSSELKLQALQEQHSRYAHWPQTFMRQIAGPDTGTTLYTVLHACRVQPSWSSS